MTLPQLKQLIKLLGPEYKVSKLTLGRWWYGA